MSGSKKVPQGQYLFREGDPPDAMYVIKTGKLAVTKTKQSAEITLAELGPGAMIGEMAFFDNKPRSASAKAIKDTEAIALPYKALHAQFAQFPEWTKAIMRTVNDHLRSANARIKALETGESEDAFPPHTVTKLMAILGLVTARYGVKEGDEIVVPSTALRNYTIQVFHEATNKMQKLLQVLSELGLAKVEEIAEGTQKISIMNSDFLFHFTEWHNEWLFKNENSRMTIREEQIPILKALSFYAKKQTPDDKGAVKLNLTQIQNEAVKETGTTVKVDDLEALISLAILSPKVTEKDFVASTVNASEIERLILNWQLVHALKKIPKDS